MGVQRKDENESKVMGVPKGLKALLADLVMSRGIHQEHAKKHYMSRNSSGLRVVDLESSHWSDLGLLNVEKTGIC